MRILYLSISYIPSRRASSIQVMQMGQALAEGGHEVTLVTKWCPARQEPGVEDDYDFYGVAPNFSILKLPRPARRGGELVYAWSVWRLLRANRDFGLVYSRYLFGAWVAARLGCPVLFEAHGLPEDRLSRILHRQLFSSPRLRRLVLISEALKNDFQQLDLLPSKDKVVVAHDGASPFGKDKEVPGSVLELSNIGFNGRPQIGYVGSLYPGKGVEVLVELAAKLPDCDFHVVGGTPGDLRAWMQRKLPPNLTFHGFVSPQGLFAYYRRFDIFLMPSQRRIYGASGRTDISRWTSPLKMFEYMAAGKPIVSSDLPVLREVLDHERNALLVPPDDIDAWQTTIKRLLADQSLRQRLAETARQDLLDHYTWQARARKVLSDL